MTWQSDLTFIVTLAAAVADLRTGKVPNRLTYSACAVALLLSLMVPPGGLIDSLAGLLGTLALYLVLHVFAGLGAGDAKLMAAVGALKGFSFSLYSSFYILCIGFAVSLVFLAWNGCLAGSARRAFSMLAGGLRSGGKRSAPATGLHTMPFAPVIFAGVAWTLWLEYSRGPVTLRFWY